MSYNIPTMKLKWFLLYLKYRRYLVPGLIALGVVVAAYLVYRYR
jgi:hypothetical protein